MNESHLMRWVGPDALQDWMEHAKSTQTNPNVDIVLITHPRDEHDLPRLFPWTSEISLKERRALARHLKPVFGEIIKTPHLNAGILFLPFFAHDLIDPSERSSCRRLLEEEGLRVAATVGCRIVCLGGLTGALSHYGRRLLRAAESLGITITTGHSLTAISVLRTYLRAVSEVGIEPLKSQMVILGLGSIGSAFANLIVRQSKQPKSLVLIDRPNRREHAEQMAAVLQEHGNIDITVEMTDSSGQLLPHTACYQSHYLISAVSTPYIINIDNVAPGTVLIDDSQPYCWSREDAINRCQRKMDIAPCEAGLVDCSSIGYRSHFPFDFADHDESGTGTAWSCLAEGLLRTVDDQLPDTIGEPGIHNLTKYNSAFDEWAFKVPRLQCGPYELPVAALRKCFRVSSP